MRPDGQAECAQRRIDAQVCSVSCAGRCAQRAELTATQEHRLVLRLAKNDVVFHLDAYVTAHRQQIAAALENWWDKYAIPLLQIEAERDAAATQLAAFLKDLGYE